MIKNKKFIDLSNGKVFEVIDHFEDIAILDNKSKVKVGKLLDKNFYDEYIDPNSFFKNDRLVSAFTEKIRQLPSEENRKEKYDDFLNENFKVEGAMSQNKNSLYDDSAIIPYDPEQEKQELLEKAKQMYRSQKTTNIDNFRHLLDEDTEIESASYENSAPKIEPYREQIITPPQNTERPIPQHQIHQPQALDPIIGMFKNVKRNNDFNLSFSINQKIPRLDFIEMMEDSYNTSIIDFLAEEFTNLLLLNPELIKNKISDEIRNLVYNRDIDTNQVKSSEKQIKSKKTKEEND